MMNQATNNVFLIRPSSFVFNSETAESNEFQQKTDDSSENIKHLALEEFELLADKLKEKGVNVYVFDDSPKPAKPDAVFPNNWISFHHDGKVILYPMLAENRRLERRFEIIESLQNDFKIKNIIDLSPFEKENRFLEGTGSIVFDHENKVGYACLSPRTDKELFLKVCQLLAYKPVYFQAFDEKGKEIYHTNVMMCVGKNFVVICLESIVNEDERKTVKNSFKENNQQIIELSFSQMQNFAGNLLLLQTSQKTDVLALSENAFQSLTATQKNELEKFCELLPISVKTIETVGGGSVRCMIAEIFSEKR